MSLLRKTQPFPIYQKATIATPWVQLADFTATLEKYAAEAPADQCGSPSEIEAEDNK